MGTCPDTIKRLIERFNQQSDQVRSPDYNETQLRIDFIKPPSSFAARLRRRIGRPALSIAEGIDELVYELYGLTEAEIKIVEASTHSASSG